MGFLCETYDRLFKGAFTEYNSKPEFRLWLPMMGKWTRAMSKHTSDLQSVYNYIASKQRHENLVKFVEGEMERLPSVYK